MHRYVDMEEKYQAKGTVLTKVRKHRKDTNSVNQNTQCDTHIYIYNIYNT